MDKEFRRPDGQLDTIAFVNQVTGDIHKTLNLQLEALGTIQHDLKRASEKNIKAESKMCIDQNTYSFNFSVMSIYVDNSANSKSITFVKEGGISYTVAANTQQWIHPLGGNYFDVSSPGGSNSWANFTDTFIPTK